MASGHDGTRSADPEVTPGAGAGAGPHHGLAALALPG